MKKVILSSIVLFLLITCLVGCDKECNHEFGEWYELVSATCTSEGLEECKCNLCGITKQNDLPIEHKWNRGMCKECSIICSHEYEKGECYKCGSIESCEKHKFEDVSINFENYDVCMNSATKGECLVCGSSGTRMVINGNCNFVPNKEKEIVIQQDANGYKYEVSVLECKTCGLNYEQKMWTKYFDNCGVLNYIVSSFILGDEIIGEFYDQRVYYDHDNDISYILSGEDCLNGYEIIETCKKCDQVAKSKSSGHIITSGNIIDLSKYSSCGGNIECYKCKVCGSIDEIQEIKINCVISDVTVVKKEDANNISHTITSGVCDKCGLSYIIDEWDEESYFGKVTSTLISIYQNDELVVTGVKKEHRYE
ncbi:MAG: hypothetical protein IJX78_06130 [Bacilli bacterium]|nr:hypothetical protein [Bacilli bacterium]